MKFYITSAYPFHPVNNFGVNWIRESIALSGSDAHTLVDDPAASDIILFLEHHPVSDPYFFKVMNHELTQRFYHKVILYTDSDNPLALIPTISPSFEKKFYNPHRERSGPYIGRHTENTSISYSKERKEPEYLFSFIGASRTHPVRNEILNIKFDNCFLKDTSDKYLWELSGEEKLLFEKQFIQVSHNSCFVLCPRGHGVNSYRLYETMEMGIAPVIISDQWIPMEGPQWDEFSIRIPEKNIAELPEWLLKNRSRAFEMGEIARKNWEKWFSKEVCFLQIARLSTELQKDRKHPHFTYESAKYFQFLRPFHFKNLLRYFKNTLMKR